MISTNANAPIYGRKPTVLEYQVVEQRSKGLFGGRMKPGDLQLILNQHSEKGWTLDRIIDRDGHGSMFSGKGISYLIFTRPVEAPRA